MIDLVGLGFKARSGKDTVARMLQSTYGYRMVSLAEPLKRGAERMFELSMAQLYGDKKEVVDEFWGLTPRNILQRLGTEAMRREFGDDFWIRALRRHIETVESRIGAQRWVVTDVRFINEALAVKSWGGRVVRVDRPGAAASGGVAGHASEAELAAWDGWDSVIVNDGDLTTLESRVVRWREDASW